MPLSKWHQILYSDLFTCSTCKLMCMNKNWWISESCDVCSKHFILRIRQVKRVTHFYLTFTNVCFTRFRKNAVDSFQNSFLAWLHYSYGFKPLYRWFWSINRVPFLVVVSSVMYFECSAAATSSSKRQMSIAQVRARHVGCREVADDEYQPGSRLWPEVDVQRSTATTVKQS